MSPAQRRLKAENETLRQQARLLRVMAHPTRLRILKELTEGTKCVSDMCEFLEVPQPNVSQHLAMLKRNGLVASHKDGTLRCYHLTNPEIIKRLLSLLETEGRNKEAGRPTGASEASHPDSLTCMKHGVAINTDRPRCPQASSKCEFRALCPVMEAVRNLERK